MQQLPRMYDLGSSYMDRRAIDEQVERLLSSRTFANKSQVRKLLNVLYLKMDSEATLKPDDVIKELWPTEIKTKRSADVATEVNRLRHALRSYYEQEGADDPITIYLPNRAPTAGESAHEARWIAAKIREGADSSGVAETLDRGPVHPTKRRKIAAATAVLAVLVILVYVLVRASSQYPRPQFGRMEGTRLRIFDATGKELWSKNFPDGFGPDWYYNETMWGPHIWFADLEGKGHTSVLFSYSRAGTPLKPQSSTLICYSDRGKEKWRWNPGRDLPELNGSPATYMTHSLQILATKNRPVKIVVASQHFPWWPMQIALVDSNGKTISEYWHSGGLEFMTLADLDGDGKQEIIATGVANGYDHKAALVVLDPDQVFGASTETR